MSFISTTELKHLLQTVCPKFCPSGCHSESRVESKQVLQRKHILCVCCSCRLNQTWEVEVGRENEFWG